MLTFNRMKLCQFFEGFSLIFCSPIDWFVGWLNDGLCLTANIFRMIVANTKYLGIFGRSCCFFLGIKRVATSTDMLLA